MKTAWGWVAKFYDLPLSAFYRKNFIFYVVATMCLVMKQIFSYYSDAYEWWDRAEFLVSGLFITLIASKLIYELAKWIIQTIRDRIRVGYW